MANTDSIVQELFRITKEKGISEWKGGVLYSSKDTLKKGDLYLMGYNPGGSGGATSIKVDIENLKKKTENSYLDEEWEPNGYKYEKGEAPFQKRVQYLFKQMGVDLRSVCSTNLIFAQSRNAEGVELKDADMCWPVHKYLINEVVKPKIIICIGNRESESAYAYLRGKYQPIAKEESRSANQGHYKIKAFQTGCETPRWVIGFPHFSRYELEGKRDEKEIIEYIMKKLQQ
jgi:hypothetical protein